MTKLNWFTHIPVPSKKQFDTSQVKPRDIKNILRNKKSTSAPGEDNITYGILAKLSLTHHFLATLFSKLLLTNDPPDMWSSSKVILIYKKGDTNEPGNFRMIALTSCVGKLYHQLLANRIIDFLTTNKLLSPDTQKAFIPKVDGCMEHGYVLQEAIYHCRQQKHTLHCTLFDLADAFGSENHELIEYTVVPATAGHRWFRGKVALRGRWPLVTGNGHMRHYVKSNTHTRQHIFHSTCTTL